MREKDEPSYVASTEFERNNGAEVTQFYSLCKSTLTDHAALVGVTITPDPRINSDHKKNSFRIDKELTMIADHENGAMVSIVVGASSQYDNDPTILIDALGDADTRDSVKYSIDWIERRVVRSRYDEDERAVTVAELDTLTGLIEMATPVQGEIIRKK